MLFNKTLSLLKTKPVQNLRLVWVNYWTNAEHTQSSVSVEAILHKDEVVPFLSELILEYLNDPEATMPNGLKYGEMDTISIHRLDQSSQIEPNVGSSPIEWSFIDWQNSRDKKDSLNKESFSISPATACSWLRQHGYKIPVAVATK